MPEELKPSQEKAVSLFLHSLYLKSVLREKDAPRNTEFHPMISAIYTKICGNGSLWTYARTKLKAWNWIECDEKYSVKHGKAMGYRLGPELMAAKFHQVAWSGGDTKQHFHNTFVPNLSLDTERAVEILASNKERRGWDDEQFDVQKWRLESFSPVFTPCSTGRLIGDANQIPSPCRAALLLDGEETTELDICNAQPLLLALCYDESDTEKGKYLALVESGQIYEYFAAKLGLTRDEAKLAFIKTIFGSCQFKEFRAVFRAEFPQLAARLRAIMKNDYKALANQLQRWESEIVVPIAMEFGAVSIHDGIRCRASEVEAVKARLIERFAELGLKPSFKVEKPLSSKAESARLLHNPSESPVKAPNSALSAFSPPLATRESKRAPNAYRGAKSRLTATGTMKRNYVPDYDLPPLLS